MEKIRTLVFKFPNVAVNCVGSVDRIQDLDNYFAIQNQPGTKIDMDIFIDRIINNGVYCYFEPNGLFYIIRGQKYVKRLKNAGLWIGQDLFVDAMYYANKEKVCEKYGISEADFETLTADSWWKDKYINK